MTTYQFAKLTGWQQSQISRFRSGAVAWSKPNDFLLDVKMDCEILCLILRGIFSQKKSCQVFQPILLGITL